MKKVLSVLGMLLISGSVVMAETEAERDREREIDRDRAVAAERARDREPGREMESAENREGPQLRISLDYLLPKDDDVWDDAVGATAQLLFGQSGNAALALSIGVQEWSANEDVYGGWTYVGSGIYYGVDTGLKGDATMVPFGLSAIFKSELGEGVNLVLEGGVRYVFVDSSVTVDATEWAMNIYGQSVAQGYSWDVDIDDGFVGLLAADLDFDLGLQSSLFAGIGYQFDISKGDVEFRGARIGENELQAFLLRAGFSFGF